MVTSATSSLAQISGSIIDSSVNLITSFFSGGIWGNILAVGIILSIASLFMVFADGIFGFKDYSKYDFKNK